MKKYAIIVAGGSGSRMGGNIPKQFIVLNGKPVLMHTMEQFRSFDKKMQLLVVLPKDIFETWKELCRQYHFTIAHTVVAGGFSRFHSVKNALAECGNEGIIVVHDGVRPFVSQAMLKRGMEMAEKTGAAIPVITPVDSLRKVQAGQSVAVWRDDYRNVQTPQIFQANILQEAYKTPYMPSFTDDASVVEYAGATISMFEGSKLNIKITTPEDVLIAEALFPIFLSSQDDVYLSPKPDAQ